MLRSLVGSEMCIRDSHSFGIRRIGSSSGLVRASGRRNVWLTSRSNRQPCPRTISRDAFGPAFPSWSTSPQPNNKRHCRRRNLCTARQPASNGKFRRVDQRELGAKVWSMFGERSLNLFDRRVHEAGGADDYGRHRFIAVCDRTDFGGSFRAIQTSS